MAYLKEKYRPSICGQTSRNGIWIIPFLLIFALTILYVEPVEAHHPSSTSGGSSGPIVTMSADTLAQGDTVIGITFEYRHFDQLSDAVLAEAAEAEQDVHGLETIQSTSLAIAYGLLDNLTIILRMPFIKRTGILEGEHGHGHGHGHGPEILDLGEPTGFGDLSLLSQWRVINTGPQGFRLALIGGVKLPTGETDELAEGEDHLLEAEFQAGSGSVDWLLGAAASQSMGQLSLHANVLYIFVNEGDQNTDLGDRFHFNLATALRVIGDATHVDEPGTPAHDDGPQVDLVLELNGEWDDRQEINGVRSIHSGGTALFISPGIRVAEGNWTAFASAGIPVLTDFNGIQAEPDWRLTMGVAVKLP